MMLFTAVDACGRVGSHPRIDKRIGQTSSEAEAAQIHRPVAFSDLIDIQEL